MANPLNPANSMPSPNPSSLSNKRAREPSSSPEPSLLSSNDLDTAGVEAQSRPRPKRPYRERWWEPNSIMPQTGTSTTSGSSGMTARAVANEGEDNDGVNQSENFIAEGQGPGNNGIDEDVIDEVEEAARAHEEKVQHYITKKPVTWADVEGEDAVIEGPIPSDAWYEKHHSEIETLDSVFVAEVVIRRCLENHEETVDISDLEMETIPDSIISPLCQWTPESPQALGGYALRDAGLKLNMSCNAFTRVPAAIFSLDDLVVLSLRNNRLTKLPPAIDRLVNLRELNIGGNLLKTLPFEVLELITEGRLRILNIDPNPFVQPPQIVQGISDGRVEESNLRRAESRPANVPVKEKSIRCAGWGPTRYAVSPVMYFNVHGAQMDFIWPAPVMPDDQGSERDVVMPTGQEGQDTVETSSDDPGSGGEIVRPTGQEGQNTVERPRKLLPSLFELCLRRVCSMTTKPSELAKCLPPDVPKHIIENLQEADCIKATGGQRCTICKENFVVARTECIEWWYCRIPEDVKQLYSLSYLFQTPWTKSGPVPFIRRGCSLICVPSEDEGDRLYLKAHEIRNVRSIRWMQNIASQRSSSVNGRLCV